jgi:hypothetical protein
MVKMMKHIVLYSGGLSSFMSAVRVKERYGSKDLILLFTDTRTEDEDLYRFLSETITWLSPGESVQLQEGRDIWQVFEDVKYHGNSRVDPCSRILKRELFRKWLLESYSPDECHLYYGIGWNEVHRLEKIRELLSPYNVYAPMTQPPYLENEDIVAFLSRINIQPPRLYSFGFPHNNCGGFCVKTGQAQMKLLYEKMPERYKYHEDKQEALFTKLGKRHPFIRMKRNGKTHYLSLRDFRILMEHGEAIDEFDYGGCGCFLD